MELFYIVLRVKHPKLDLILELCQTFLNVLFLWSQYQLLELAVDDDNDFHVKATINYLSKLQNMIYQSKLYEYKKKLES